MGANVKIGANSSEFQKQMKDMVRQMKVLGSEFNLANTKAKLFGSGIDSLKVKQTDLTNKLKIQNKMVETQGNHLKNLTGILDKQKVKQTELKGAIEKVTESYKKTVEATGKTSEESKQLKKQLQDLKQEYSNNERAIDSSNKKIDSAKISLNNNKKSLEENKKALDDVNKSIKNFKVEELTGKLDKFSEKTGNLSNKLAPLVATITGVGVVAGKSAMDFSKSMQMTGTLLDGTGEQVNKRVKELSGNVLQISNDTGVATSDISSGLYEVISAFGDTSDSAEILRTAVDGAKSSGATTTDTIKLLSAVTKGYGDTSSGANKKVSDLAFLTAKLGQTTFPELASSIGQVVPLSESLGVSQEELFGVMATATGVTGTASEVSTQYKNVLQALSAPTKEMSALMKKLGYENGKAMIKNLGLQGTINAVTKAADESGKPLQSYIGSVEGQTLALALSGAQAENFTQKTKAMNDATGATDRAVAQTSQALGTDFNKAINSAKNSMISFGDATAPLISVVASGISTVGGFLNGLSDGQKQFIAYTGAFIVASTLTLKGISSVTGAISGGIKNFKKFRETMTEVMPKLKDVGATCLKGAKSVGNFAKSIGKIGWNGITKGASLAKQGITGLARATFNGAKAVGTFTLNLLKMGVQLAVSGAKMAFNTAKMIAHKVATVATSAATKLMSLAQAALNFVMSLNPITLIIGLLIGLGATFLILYNKCEWFRNGVKAVWNGITSVFKTFNNFLSGAFTTDWTQKLGLLGVPLNYFFGVVGSIWNGVKGIFSGIIDFVAGVFTGDWSRAWNGVKQVFSSIFSTLGGILKAPINAAISAVNVCVRGLNKLNFTVPDWIPGIGGKHFGFNIPQIPKLAEGGYVDKATLAVVGEGKSAEIVAPEPKLNRAVYENTLKALKQKQEQNIYIVVNSTTELDGEVIGNKVYKTVAKKTKSDTDSYRFIQGKRGFSFA